MDIFFRVVRRNGEIVEFDPERITKAIFEAAKSVGGEDINTAKKLTMQVKNYLAKKFSDRVKIDVEEIQDAVEKMLIEDGHYKTAKAYILYREHHTKVREINSAMIDVDMTINEYLRRDDWRVNENSNTQYSFSGLMLHISGKVISSYLLNEIYTPAISNAHKDAYLHVHDLSNGIVGYCAGWSLKNLLVQGFGKVANKVDAKPAKHLDVVVSQMVNFIGCMQMEFAGAQAFSSVDTFLAPFVKSDDLSYDQVKQNMQRLIFSLNIPSRWGSQTPFSNLTFDWVVPEDLKDEKVIVGGERQDYTYGECQKEMDMINKAFLELMMHGDAKGRIFTFPIPTYNITSDFNWKSDNAKLLFDVTAKYGTPYFQNYIGSGLEPSAVRAMCCRLNLDQRELMKRPGGMWAPGDSTGSIGVVTVNINRIAYEAKSKKEFLKKLKHYMLIAKDSLEIKRKLVNRNMEQGLMPYTSAYLGTFNNHFSTIGLCGMNEACVNYIGEDISSKRGKKFAVDTLDYMREVLKEFQEETGNLYNLEASPAESTSYRFAKKDLEMYPHIYVSGDEEKYLTNSTQLPVGYTEDLFAALEHQSDIQNLYTGGTMFHTFLGEEMEGDSCKELVRKIAENTKLPYFSITPTFSVCKDHGYIKGQEAECPECGNETEIYSRIVGYFRPVKNWNVGKKEEFKERKTYLAETMIEKDVVNEPVKKQTAKKQTKKTKTKKVVASKNTSGERKLKMFVSDNCPNCVTLKKIISQQEISIPTEEINVWTDSGLEQSRKFSVNTVPTMVVLDDAENIIKTVKDIEEIKNDKNWWNN
ncbi:MAG: ribonucleoside triphosphate reductase [Candidatus Muiribacterium halophilum]|uniref:Ribonucleoside triphosphate reductase n=1 Tax=Muiribacterium halophilum TaxID=2053465 RepID=A0A2N5ZKS8_MUIH1|nr:MAG: ribonucleoside triphosphate reductase [Candidatus Muirbacterium halophilum]